MFDVYVSPVYECALCQLSTMCRTRHNSYVCMIVIGFLYSPRFLTQLPVFPEKHRMLMRTAVHMPWMTPSCGAGGTATPYLLLLLLLFYQPHHHRVASELPDASTCCHKRLVSTELQRDFVVETKTRSMTVAVVFGPWECQHDTILPHPRLHDPTS